MVYKAAAKPLFISKVYYTFNNYAKNIIAFIYYISVDYHEFLALD